MGVHTEGSTLTALDGVSTIVNFRDLAGFPHPRTGIGQRPLRSGRIYRSGTFAPTDTELSLLSPLSLAVVIDLRTPQEVERRPDRIPAGVRYEHISILGTGTRAEKAVYGPIADPDEARQSLRRLYQGFVTDPDQREQFRTVIHHVAQSQGPLLFHCSYGKDRSGWTAAMLQFIAEVPLDDIVTEYLLSNDFLAHTNRERQAQAAADDSAQEIQARAPLYEVQEEYLRSGLAQITQDFGSVDNYLRRGIGLTEDTLRAIQHLLVSPVAP